MEGNHFPCPPAPPPLPSVIRIGFEGVSSESWGLGEDTNTSVRATKKGRVQ